MSLKDEIEKVKVSLITMRMRNEDSGKRYVHSFLSFSVSKNNPFSFFLSIHRTQKWVIYANGRQALGRLWVDPFLLVGYGSRKTRSRSGEEQLHEGGLRTRQVLISPVSYVCNKYVGIGSIFNKSSISVQRRDSFQSQMYSRGSFELSVVLQRQI